MTATETLPEYDPSLPTFEVWINGRRYASTQIPGRAYKLMRTMAAGRPSHVAPELRVVNDRRLTERADAALVG